MSVDFRLVQKHYGGETNFPLYMVIMPARNRAAFSKQTIQFGDSCDLSDENETHIFRFYLIGIFLNRFFSLKLKKWGNPSPDLLLEITNEYSNS